MKVSSERIEGCRIALTIEAESEELEKARDKAYRQMVKKVAVPGFRKGKAPRALFEHHVGNDYLESEALDDLIPELYQQAIEQEKVAIIGQPEMEMVQKDPLIFKATVPIPPEVELGDYHSINITPEPIEITDDDISQGIENLRKMHAIQEPVEREAQFNDVVTININATVEDKTILERESDTFRLTEGSDIPTPGFVDEIVGMSAGDEKEFTLTFPENHPNEELIGKDCDFSVSISAVKEETLPELDDEFAKSLGQEIETVDQLKEKLQTNMRSSAERENRTKLENEVIDAIADISSIEFPAIFTEQQIDQIAEDQMMRMGGMKLEDFLRYRGATEEDFRNDLRPTAEKRVIGSLILNKVHEAENITIDDAEIDAEIDRIVEEAGEQGEMARQMFSSAEAKDSTRGRLLTEKTLKTLIEIATSGGAESTDETPNEVPETKEETAAEEE